jgi:predicted Fe-Mo cluster-binding NifX family protein
MSSRRTRETKSKGQAIMKIGFAVQLDQGMESVVYGHFGSAPAFIIVDSEQRQALGVRNSNAHHEHGACNPIKALNGSRIDAMVVGGIGAGALMKLNAMGVKVFGAGASTVKENVVLLEENKLRELSMDNSCRSHEGQCRH